MCTSCCVTPGDAKSVLSLGGVELTVAQVLNPEHLTPIVPF